VLEGASQGGEVAVGVGEKLADFLVPHLRTGLGRGTAHEHSGRVDTDLESHRTAHRVAVDVHCALAVQVEHDMARPVRAQAGPAAAALGEHAAEHAEPAEHRPRRDEQQVEAAIRHRGRRHEWQPEREHSAVAHEDRAHRLVPGGSLVEVRRHGERLPDDATAERSEVRRPPPSVLVLLLRRGEGLGVHAGAGHHEDVVGAGGAVGARERHPGQVAVNRVAVQRHLCGRIEVPAVQAHRAGPEVGSSRRHDTQSHLVSNRPGQ